MPGRKGNIRITVLIQILNGIVFIGFALFALFTVRNLLQQQAVREAEEKTAIILNRNLATHTYFSHNLKPAVFELTDPYRPEEYFDPVWMSSTYAVREIDKYFTDLSDFGNYYYKEVAINARSPENEADPYEAEILQSFNADPTLEKFSDIREIYEEAYLFTVIRGEVMEESCLRCHSTPDAAPGGLVDIYGDSRSFDRESGEVASAIAIHVPLAQAYTTTEKTTLWLAGIFLVVLLALFFIQYWLQRLFIMQPILAIKDQAYHIATDKSHLGKTIPEPLGKELAELTSTFNIMSGELKAQIENQENIILERTNELAVSEEKYRNLFNNNLNGVALHQIVTDETGKAVDYIFIEVNDAFETLTGLRREDVVGKRVSKAIPSIHDTNFIEIYGRVALQGESLRFESYAEPLERTFNIVAFSPSRGYFATIFEDITIQKVAEATLKEHSEKLETLVEEQTETITETREELARAAQLAAIGELASGIGHELRNPLASISNAVYYLKNTSAEDPKRGDMIQLIDEEVQVSAKIINDLLTFSREIHADKTRVDLSELVKKALAEITVPDDIKVELDLLQETPAVEADPQQITQILDNLMRNACQAMPDGGTLKVQMRTLPHEVQVCIVDSGVGIPEEIKPKIFAPLFSTKPSGTGLGLGLAEKYAYANGGRITFDSQVGKGSTFTLHLPVIKK